MKKVFLFVLVTFALLFAAVGCVADPSSGAKTSSEVSTSDAPAEDTEPAEPPKEEFRLAFEGGFCSVIRPIDASDAVVNAAVSLRKKLNAVLDTSKIEIGNDFVKPGAEFDSTRYEILVGITAYPETLEFSEKLRYLDYAVAIRGRKILVYAEDPDRLAKAADYLITMIGKNKISDGQGNVSVTFDDYIFSAGYRAPDMKINGNSIKDYKIIYSKKDGVYKSAADTVQSLLANATGYMLDILPDTSAKSAHEIIIGKTNRADVSPKTTEYGLYVDGDRMVFDCCGQLGAEAAVKKLYSERLHDGKNTDIENSYRLYGSIDGDFEGQPMTEGADLRIISFNILTEKWGGTDTSPRCELLGIMLENYRPDAVGVQETCAIWRSMIPYFCGDYKLICTVCPDGTENYSAILYDSSRYEVGDSGVIPYSKTANKLCRNMGWAVLKSRTDDVRFILISTHWDFDNAENNRSEYRKVQAQELSATVSRLAEKYSCPVFTTGDYNCIQSSDSMTYFRGINNMWCSKFDSEVYFNRYGSCSSLGTMTSSGGNSIDFVFGTKDTKCLGNMIIINSKTEQISDHRPVLADIKLLK